MRADMEKISGFGVVSVSPRAIECDIESLKSLASGRKRYDLPVLKRHDLTHCVHEGVSKLHLLSTDRSLRTCYSRRHVELPGLSIANVLTSHLKIRTTDQGEKLLDITLVLEGAGPAKVYPQRVVYDSRNACFGAALYGPLPLLPDHLDFAASGKARPPLRSERPMMLRGHCEMDRKSECCGDGPTSASADAPLEEGVDVAPVVAIPASNDTAMSGGRPSRLHRTKVPLARTTAYFFEQA